MLDIPDVCTQGHSKSTLICYAAPALDRSALPESALTSYIEIIT